MGLPYFIGTVDKLKSYGIDTEGLRTSITGEVTEALINDEVIITDTRKAIVHQDNLTPDQVRAIRFDNDIELYYDDELETILSSEEWQSEEVI